MAGFDGGEGEMLEVDIFSSLLAPVRSDRRVCVRITRTVVRMYTFVSFAPLLGVLPHLGGGGGEPC